MAAAVDQGWALPLGAQRPDVPLTPIGNLDGAVGATVDPRGLVTVAGGAWSLDWWVGADDRWHLASQEAGTRQALVGGAPVVETRLRVPGGDAVHRAWAARDGSGNEHLVVEVANETSVPFALAWVLRPFDAHGVVAGSLDGGLAFDESGTCLVQGGAPVLLLSRPAARAAGAVRGGDLVEVVTSGSAPVALGDAADGPEPGVALVVPVTHGTRVRVLLPIDAAADARFRDDLPDADQVASGWDVHVRQGARIELPDSHLAAGLASARSQLLAVTADPPGTGRRHVDAVGDFGALALALDEHGFADEAEALLHRLVDLLPGWRRPDPEHAAIALAACAFAGLARPETADPERLAAMSALARRAERAPDRGPAALALLARLLERIGQPQAAGRVRRNRVVPPDEPPPAAAWAELVALTGNASATWTWPHRRDHARRVAFVGAIRSVLVDDRSEHVCVLPDGIGPWWGLPVDVHDLPTTHGRLSWALRWHGDRPALLWDLVPSGPPDGRDPRSSYGTAAEGATSVRRTDPAVLLRCALDPSWSSTEARGEALLAPVPRPADSGGPIGSAPAPGQGAAESVAPRSVLPLARPAEPRRATDRRRRRGLVLVSDLFADEPADMGDLPTVRAVLNAHGVSDDEIDGAERNGTLGYLAIDHLVFPDPAVYDLTGIAEVTGMPADQIAHLWRSLGFPDPGGGDRIFTETDADMLHTVAALMELGLLEPDLAVQMSRVIGSSMARIAGAMIDAIGTDDETESSDDEDFAVAAGTLMPTMPRVMDYVWRRHMQASARRKVSREAAAGEEGSTDLAVGFADLVGFTALSQQVDEHELAAMVDRFETMAYDTIIQLGGRVVKMIGDEVMFVCDDVHPALEVALTLAEVYAKDTELSDVRVGLAVGPVLEREADYYGPTVNLASRIVGIAFPGSVVVSEAVHAACQDVDGVEWRFLKARKLKDIGRVPLWTARRPDQPESAKESSRDKARRRQAERRERRSAADDDPDHDLDEGADGPVDDGSEAAGEEPPGDR